MTAQSFKNGILFSICATLVSGCTMHDSKARELNIHHPKVELSLDPHKMEDAYSMMIITQIHRGLLRFNSLGDVVADLAESWTESTDRKIYRFKLKNATFSDGTAITAKNVLMSFARIFILQAGIGADIDYIQGAKKFSKTKDLNDLGIKVITEQEIEFILSQPSALFLKHLAVVDCAVLPFTNLTEIESSPKAYSGPYKVLSTSADKITLQKWRKDFLESKASPEVIHFFPTEESPTALAKKGITDTLDKDPVTDEEKEYFKARGWGESPTEITGEVFVILNPNEISLELRKYLFHQVDPKEITKIMDAKKFIPAFGLIPTGFSGELALNEVQELAKDKTDYRGPKKVITIDYAPSSDNDKKIADYLKSVWSHPKIELKFIENTKAEKLKKMFSKKAQVIIGKKGIDYPDGYSVLTYFKGSYESNYFYVNDANIDDTITNAVKEFDLDKRTQVYKNIQREILKKYTIIPLVFGSQASGLWSEKIKMVPSHPMGYHTMPFETIEMRVK